MSLSSIMNNIPFVCFALILNFIYRLTMLVSPHNSRDDTPGVSIVTQLEGGGDESADDDDGEPTVLESTHNKSGEDNKDEIKVCEDTELATKEDNKNDMGDEVESGPGDSELSSDDDEEEEMEKWLPPTNKNSKKCKYSKASQQPTKVGVALSTDFSLDGGLSPLDTIPQLYKILMDTLSPGTQAIFDTWTPCVPFQWLASRYSKREKVGYFRQSCWDMVRIISEELGYTVTEYLNFRSWGFHRSQKNNQPCLPYHCFESCMKDNQEQVEVNKWMSMAADVLKLARAVLRKKSKLVMELVLIVLHQSGWLYFYLTT